MRRIVALATAVMSCSPALASAQLIRHPLDVLEVPSLVAYGWPDGYYYEGIPAAALYIHSNGRGISSLGTTPANADASSGCRLAGLLRVISLHHDEVAATGCVHTFVPRFVIRQLADSSAAVKPPTFNPFYEWTTFRFMLPESARRSTGDADYSKLSGHFDYMRLKLAHYSNGQAGCTYVNDEYVYPDAVKRDAICKPKPVLPDTVLNTRDGDFSTTYFETGYGKGIFKVGESGTLQHYLLAEVAFIQHTHQEFLRKMFGAMSDEQRRTYGTREATLTVRGNYYSTALKGIALDGTGIVNHRFGSAFGADRSEMVVTLSSAQLWGLGIGARWEAGFDPYNIAYGRSVDRRGALVLVFDRRTRSDRFKFTESQPQP